MTTNPKVMFIFACEYNSEGYIDRYVVDPTQPLPLSKVMLVFVCEHNSKRR